MATHSGRRDESGRADRGSARRSGLTVRELANEAGVTERTVYRIVAGERDPRLGTLEALARGLGVETAELLDEPPKSRREWKALVGRDRYRVLKREANEAMRGARKELGRLGDDPEFMEVFLRHVAEIAAERKEKPAPGTEGRPKLAPNENG